MNNGFLDFWAQGRLGKGQRGLFTGPVDRGAGPGGPRGSAFLLLPFGNRKLKRIEALE